MTNNRIGKTYKHVKFLLIVSCTLLVCILDQNPTRSQASFTSFYVAPNGNNNNPGTLAAPWRTIGYAANNNIVQPGDTVYIRSGTYNEYIQQRISGSPGQPITYRNYPNETPIITGSGTWRWHILEHSYIRIEGLTFSNYRKGAIQIRTRHASISGIEIINCTFRNQELLNGAGDKTIHVSTGETNFLIDHVTIRGNQLTNLNTGDHPAIQIAANSRNVLVIDNTIAGVSSIAIGVAGRSDSGQPRNVIVRGNNISGHGSPGKHSPGVYLDGAGENIIVEKNVIHDGIQGIKVGIELVASSLTTRYVIVRHNVLYNNSQINLKLGVGADVGNCTQAGTLERSVAVHNTVFSSVGNTANNYFGCGRELHWKNNIFAHTANGEQFQYRYGESMANPSSWLLDYNFFYSSSGTKYYGWQGQRYSSLAAFRTASNQELHSSEGDPRFVNVAARDFRLLPASPARDSGGTLTTTRSAGSGTVIPVQEVWYFSDGFGLQDGDRIRIGDNAPVTVTGVNYTNRTLSINRSVTWENQDHINYDYAGNGPDMGAYEFVPQLTLHGRPADQAIYLTWEVNEQLPPDVIWRIEYEGTPGQSPSPITAIPGNVNSYVLNGMVNYELYHVSIVAIVNNEPVLEDSISMMPTDLFIYLPAMNK